MTDVNFTDEHKEEVATAFFEEGVHHVKMTKFEQKETDAGKAYVAIDVEGEGGEVTTIKQWFVGGAIKYSFNTIRSLFVHNVPKNKKDAIRTEIDKLVKLSTLVAAAQQNLVGKEAWIRITQSGTYTDAQGDTKPSYDREIFAYEPKPKKNTQSSSGAVADIINSATPLTDGDGEEVFTF